jgi:glyoxalase/bleomycin resistance protein/dioxygenase superfamily protein
MAREDFPAPSEGFVLTHFIVAADVARSRDFYVGVLGGTVVMDGEPTIVKLANGWVTINIGGGPTDDKPEVVLEPPSDPNRVSAFLNIRVADIQAAYEEWREGGHVPHPTQGPRCGDPLLHARPRRPPHRGRSGDRGALLALVSGADEAMGKQRLQHHARQRAVIALARAGRGRPVIGVDQGMKARAPSRRWQRSALCGSAVTPGTGLAARGRGDGLLTGAPSPRPGVGCGRG